MPKRDARGRFVAAGKPKPKARPKPLKVVRQERANRKRSRTMKRRWEEARHYADTTGEPLSLARRIVTIGAPYNPGDGRRRSTAASAAEEVRRLGGGTIPPDGLPLKLTIRKAGKGKRVKMEARILIPPGAGAQDIRRILRDAWEAGIRSRSKHYRSLEVNDSGELFLDGELYFLELAPDTRAPDSSLTQPTRSPADAPAPRPPRRSAREKRTGRR